MSQPHLQNLTSEDIARAQRSVAPLNDRLKELLVQAGPGSRLIAWLSDLHVHARRNYGWPAGAPYATAVDTSTHLRLALEEIRTLTPAPDLVIFGGDLTDHGANPEFCEDEFAALSAVLDASLPKQQRSAAILGNHDHNAGPLSEMQRRAFKNCARADWPQSSNTADYCYALDVGGWRYIALDSRAGAQPLAEAQRRWLAAELERDDASPSIILAHRPFVSVGNWVDNHRLLDRATLELIHASKSIRAVLSGHTHKAAAWQYFGKKHVVFPSTAYGIGHAIGWSCIVLGASNVQAVLVKDLATSGYDDVSDKLAEQIGTFRQLSMPLFENSELCDPCTMPRRKSGLRA